MLLTIELSEDEFAAVQAKAGAAGTDDLGAVVKAALAAYQPSVKAAAAPLGAPAMTASPTPGAPPVTPR